MRRAIVLFSRGSAAEALLKGCPRAVAAFDLAEVRLDVAARQLGATFVVAGRASTVGDGARFDQRGTGFSERLTNALADAFERGFDEVVVVANDTPGLGTAELAEAFAALTCEPAVFGPAHDGGVYLLGARASSTGHLAALRRAPWRSPLLARYLEVAGFCGLAVRLPDLDGPRSLRLLRSNARDRGDIDLARLIGQMMACEMVPWVGISASAAGESRVPRLRGPPRRTESPPSGC